MSGRHHYNVLTSAYDRNHLIESAPTNGLYWEQHDNEGVNWMRFSHALVQHLDEGKDFHTDGNDPEALKQMLDQYITLRDTHKQSMIPHIRAAMAKLYSDNGSKGDGKPMDYLTEAYKHLDANGGHAWAEKVSTLSNLNRQINNLHTRLDNIGRMNGGQLE